MCSENYIFNDFWETIKRNKRKTNTCKIKLTIKSIVRIFSNFTKTLKKENNICKQIERFQLSSHIL